MLSFPDEDSMSQILARPLCSCNFIHMEGPTFHFSIVRNPKDLFLQQEKYAFNGVRRLVSGALHMNSRKGKYILVCCSLPRPYSSRAQRFYQMWRIGRRIDWHPGLLHGRYATSGLVVKEIGGHAERVGFFKFDHHAFMYEDNKWWSVGSDSVGYWWWQSVKDKRWKIRLG